MTRSSSRRSPFAGNRGNGSKWIRRAKRLRIYARDRWRCVWCQVQVWSPAQPDAALARLGARLATLDHVLPRDRGGTNEAHNLVTACADCNEARGARSAVEFAGTRYGEGGDGPGFVFARLLDAMLEPLPPG